MYHQTTISISKSITALLSLLTSHLTTSSPLPSSSELQFILKPASPSISLSDLASQDTSITFTLTDSNAVEQSSQCTLQWSSHHCAHPPINQAIACESSGAPTTVTLRTWRAADDFSFDLVEFGDATNGRAPNDEILKGHFTLTPETAAVECDCDGQCYQSTDEDEVDVELEWKRVPEAFVNRIEDKEAEGESRERQYMRNAGQGMKVDLKRV